MSPDYYKILNVPPTANEMEIKKAYRELAKKYHPDVSKDKDAKVIFQIINQAYQVLLDKDKRKFYDAKTSFEYANKKKYGPNYAKRAEYFYKAQKARENYYRSINHPLFDKYAFIVWFVIAGVAILLGLYDIISEGWDEPGNIRGVFIGITMMALLIAGYRILHPKK
ncbi:MAG: DnaJ domain-containing protein [Bacteroidota bacterium]|nr:DnaJ domain-containing protein [Bacteroidota bacterium]